MGHMFPVQSPPSSTGQFLHLPNHHQQPRQMGDTAITPNSTPGLQTPTPSATPPIIGMDNRENNLFHSRIVPGQDLENVGDMDPMMGWRGLQALQVFSKLIFVLFLFVLHRSSVRYGLCT